LHKKDSSYESDFNSTVQLSISKYLARHEVLNISIITYYEILSGLTYKKATRQIDAFKSFAKECNIINLSNEITEIGANIYGDLRRNGFTIGHSVILIAATAISHNLVLITNNQKHYKSIIDLQLDNWS
jgi:tRNA(fMet)-specific endonuclease VapC